MRLFSVSFSFSQQNMEKTVTSLVIGNDIAKLDKFLETKSDEAIPQIIRVIDDLLAMDFSGRQMKCE
jgi:hypothetical protein